MLKIIKWILPAFYPDLCLLCSKEQKLPEGQFCLGCKLDLPYTDHFTNANNHLVRHFWGRVPVEFGAALFDFRKKHPVRHLVHRFKYYGEKRIGMILGQLAGEKLNKLEFHDPIDGIIPVPTTRKKLRRRGFNQADIFAMGVQSETGLPILRDLLEKVKNTESQTKKTRAERIRNVAGSFALKNEIPPNIKHLLIVDDVLTTGVTIQTCIEELYRDGLKFSILTIGLARG